jgi:two-component system, cell cycle sensor histidine kinase and response regulator CckA
MTVQHSLLRRQLIKHFRDPANVPPEWEAFIAAVDQAYAEADSDRRMVERSLDLSSQELLQANAQLRTLLGRAKDERDRFFAVSLDLLAVASFDGYFKQLNPAWERTLGWTIEELLARPLIEFVHPDDRTATAEEIHREISGEQTLTFENRYRCKDGSYRWLQWNAFSITLRDEGLIYATARDVTEHRRLEDQLRQSQKMDAIGRLAGGIAHDFNNLLTVILGYADRLQSEIDEGRASRDTLKEIRAAAERAAALTKQLLAFSRRQVLQPRVLALNDIVQDMQQMLQRLIGENIELVTRLSPDLGLVRADPGQLDQVIVNLAVNARDAMPQGGRLEIETANVKVAGPRWHDPDLPPGDYVRLAVTDTGVGISAQTQARMFEPFFTSKEAGKGTGLGLATVYGIVKQSGGHISVHTELGKGSTFTIMLPQHAEDARAARPAAAQDARAGGIGGETILLVEDEEGVRRLARAELAERGYVVLEAANCEEAFARSKRHRGPIHLLLTDVVMPDGSGRFVAERLTAERPGMRVLYMSGYTDSTMLHHGIAETGLPFLQKPFTTVSLANKVREVMDADRATRHASR